MYSPRATTQSLGTLQSKLLTALPGEVASGRLLDLKYHRETKGKERDKIVPSSGIHRKLRYLIRAEAVERTTPLSCEQFED